MGVVDGKWRTIGSKRKFDILETSELLDAIVKRDLLSICGFWFESLESYRLKISTFQTYPFEPSTEEGVFVLKENTEVDEKERVKVLYIESVEGFLMGPSLVVDAVQEGRLAFKVLAEKIRLKAAE